MNGFRVGRAGSLLCLVALGVCGLPGQTAEVTAKDAPFTFRSGVNLVPVPVVVRDSRGNAVGNLTIDDFQLLDNGKPQMISKFSVEKLVNAAAEPAPDRPRPAAAGAAQDGSVLTGANPDGIPDRFVAYVFDDLHMNLQELSETRSAAKRQMDSSLHGLDRAAVFTTSGHQTQEFTADREKLHAAVDAITVGQAAAENAMQQNLCPQMTYYMADRTYNKYDMAAWIIAMEDVIVCADLSAAQVPTCIQAAQGPTDGPITCISVDFSRSDMGQAMVKAAARVALAVGDRQTEAMFGTLRGIVSRMAAMPGQRSIVLVSPGFQVPDDRHEEETALVERAIRAKVVVGALDARGLYTQITGGDASVRVTNPYNIAAKIPFVQLESAAQTDVMATLAYGTGGSFYHGTNDYDAGFARVAAVPEYRYVLGFSPLDLKQDGRYHTLKVTLKNIHGMEIQARTGYYGPASSADPAEIARRQIEEAFFSRDEVHDLAAVLQTQYFKTDNGDATLSAVTKVDVRKLSFRREGDRNRDDLTVVTGLFDNDGNFMTGEQKIIEMRLLDDTLGKRAGNGFAVKNSFTVHPGRYVVRMVVRDSEGQLMSAQSSLVEIP